MPYGGRFLSAISHGWSAAVGTYRKSAHTSSPIRDGRGVLEDFDKLENRLFRYKFWWALYQNNAYDNVNAWAGRFKTDWAIYKNTRGCYNPCLRIGNFWATHIWTGRLDALKHNGRVADSACPIVTANNAIREPIARLWRDSNWAVNKEITARTGGVLGDAPLRVEDDTRAGKVRILPVNPATVHWVRHDYQGNVDAYVIRERRWDPEFDPATEDTVDQEVVDYEERCFRDGDTIHVETYTDGEPYKWNGVSARYEEEYGFVPLVLIPHCKVLPDSSWGWSEFQGGLTKIVEVDHVASNLHSQIRKASQPKWWVSGTAPPPTGTRFPVTAPTAAAPQPHEDELSMAYGGAGSHAEALVYPLDIQFTSMEIQNQLSSIEKDYPELRFESARASGDASAKALREVRKACEAKVHGRRAGYDNALVRAHQMALSIGGMRGYDGYEAFDLGSFAAGDLDHSIGERTVFLLDPLDREEERNAKLTNWELAKRAGIPAEFYMKLAEFSEEEIDDFQRMLEEEQDRNMQQQVDLIGAQAEAKAAAAPAPTVA
jgi:hypothetical protein